MFEQMLDGKLRTVKDGHVEYFHFPNVMTRLGRFGAHGIILQWTKASTVTCALSIQ